MPEQQEVETSKPMTGKTVISFTKPTPMWATWVFRIIFLLTSAVLVIIAADNSISDEVKFKVALYLKGADIVIWGIARGLGVDRSQFEQ